MRRRGLELLVIATAGLVASCAATPPKAGPQTAVGSGPSLGLIGPETPDLLSAVRRAPYAPPPEDGCAALWAEVAALDKALGPDVDVAVEPQRRMGDLAVSAIAGLVPYRGVIRFADGAHRKEQALARAVLAGTARRGYLKGVAQAKGCAPRPGA